MATSNRRERCNRHPQVQSAHCCSCIPITTTVRPTSRAHSSLQPLPAYALAPLRSLTMPPVHGRRRAVLCGVSYKGKDEMLEGTINDVKCMKQFLVDQVGFPSDSVLVLTEEEADPNRIPTKCNILKALRWLIQGCRAHDSLVFHFSGHGTRHIDLDMDEIDGYDESISPVDHDTEGDIRDDEINSIIVRPLPRGATLHALFDACHSGTALDLPFFCHINREGFYRWQDQTVPKSPPKGTNGGLAICIGACDDHRATEETDAFSKDKKQKTGALTYSFIQSMQGNGQVAPTYGNLLSAMRDTVREAQKKGAPPFGILRGPLASLVNRVLSHRLSTKPQLSSSDRFEIYSTRVAL